MAEPDTGPPGQPPEQMIVIVCGGRNYADRDFVFAQLDWMRDHYPRGLRILDGGAPGADRWAREWRADRLIPGRTFRAKWASDGNAAGPRRNARMLREGLPNLVLAFPGGKGTADMIRQAQAAGVSVVLMAAHLHRGVKPGSSSVPAA